MLTFDDILGIPHYERGRVEAQREILIRQLTRRFGPLPQTVEARVAAAGAADLERWLDCILDAASLDDVFAD